MASLEAFSRMYLRSVSVRPGRASEISTRRTSVGEPCYRSTNVSLTCCSSSMFAKYLQCPVNTSVHAYCSREEIVGSSR
jgi:hypothetical protein